jgi:hypothetical protein
MANRFREPRIYKAKTTEVLNAITSEWQWLKFLIDNGKPYQKLLDLLITEEGKEDSEFNTIKKLAAYLEENQAKATKWINMIYEDVWTLNEESPELFRVVDSIPFEMYFKGSYHGPDVVFIIYLPYTLQYGDAFNWSFVNPKLGSYYFYVDGISHYYEYGKMRTTTHLQEGIFNRYRHHLIDKADFHGLISFDEKYSLPKYQLDDLLRERTKNVQNYDYLRNEVSSNFF